MHEMRANFLELERAESSQQDAPAVVERGKDAPAGPHTRRDEDGRNIPRKEQDNRLVNLFVY